MADRIDRVAAAEQLGWVKGYRAALADVEKVLGVRVGIMFADLRADATTIERESRNRGRRAELAAREAAREEAHGNGAGDGREHSEFPA